MARARGGSSVGLRLILATSILLLDILGRWGAWMLLDFIHAERRKVRQVRQRG